MLKRHSTGREVRLEKALDLVLKVLHGTNLPKKELDDVMREVEVTLSPEPRLIEVPVERWECGACGMPKAPPPDKPCPTCLSTEDRIRLTGIKTVSALKIENRCFFEAWVDGNGVLRQGSHHSVTLHLPMTNQPVRVFVELVDGLLGKEKERRK